MCSGVIVDTQLCKEKNDLEFHSEFKQLMNLFPYVNVEHK